MPIKLFSGDSQNLFSHLFCSTRSCMHINVITHGYISCRILLLHHRFAGAGVVALNQCYSFVDLLKVLLSVFLYLNLISGSNSRYSIYNCFLSNIYPHRLRDNRGRGVGVLLNCDGGGVQFPGLGVVRL